MKRIAIIITRMIPGGASNVVRQIIEGGRRVNKKLLSDEDLTTQNNYEFILFTGTEAIDEDLIGEMSEYCTVIKIPDLVRNISPLKDYMAYRHLICELRKNNFDIVHTHTSKAGFIGRLAAAKAQVPVIIHSPHGTIYTAGSNIEGVPQFSLGKKLLQMAERFVGNMTTIMTTLSQNEKDICIKLKLSKKENTVVIPNGINCAYFALSDQDKIKFTKEFSIDKKNIVIISIGRLSSEKGHSVLIDAFEKVNKRLLSEPVEGKTQRAKEKYPTPENLKLILLGDGPEKPNLIQQVVDLNLDYSNRAKIENIQSKNLFNHKITFLGHCHDIRKYLAIADIAVIPSFYEGFGIAVIEAMAAGLPVIASDVGGIPEIITDGENGILFPVGNSTELAEKTFDIMSNPEKAKNISEAAQKRAEYFSEKSILQRYFNLYDSVKSTLN